ncbi:MAG: thiamine pyrophosphate-dependent dehydrogenase E1 component subunit alpha [Acidobacteriota bacterium]
MSYSALLTDRDLVQMYRWLVLVRAFEDRVCDLWTMAKLMELPHGSQGQEAISVGACYGLRREDQVLPSLRTRGAFFLKGISTRIQMAGMFNKTTGAAEGRASSHHMGDAKRGVLVGSGIIGASITVGVGAALALKLQKTDHVVLNFFGDGAAQRGDFHEGLNFAGVFKLPVVFVLENNGWAEMTPVAKHFAGQDFACRAQGYGFPGARVDGNDIFAVYDAVQSAIARARAGEGPTLVECVTYRLRGHCENNPVATCRPMAEVEAWRAKDPIPKMRGQLLERGVLTDATVASIDAEVAADIEDAIAFAEQSPAPDVNDLCKHVYAPESADLVAGRRS